MRYLCNLLYFSIILDVRSFPLYAPEYIHVHMLFCTALSHSIHFKNAVDVPSSSSLYMQLDDTWGNLLQQYQMMLYESIGYYGNAVKEMEDLGGGFHHQNWIFFNTIVTQYYSRPEFNIGLLQGASWECLYPPPSNQFIFPGGSFL